MLGVTNAKYNADYEFTPDNSVDLTFLAGGRIDKGDLVEVISEDLPKVYPTYGQDTSIQSALGTLSKPTLLDNNKNIYQAFHMSTNAWNTNTNIYSTLWRSATRPITHSNTVGSINTLLSAIPSYSWSEPLYIGDGFWLIAGQGSGSSATSKAKASLTYPSQVLLVQVDQQSGLAMRVDVDYTYCNFNYSYYGKPIIMQVSDTEFVVVFEAYLNSIYQVLARPFTVVTDMSDTTNPKGTITWTSDAVSVFPSSAAFVFYGHCCNFVNKDTRHMYFMLNNYVTYAHIELTEDGLLRTYANQVLNPDMTSIWEVAPLYGYKYSWTPLVMNYYNNFGMYNHITTSNNKHFLSVYNYYYWDFTVDYDSHIMTAKVFPLFKNANCRVLLNQWQTEGTDSQRTCRDWDLATNYITSSKCNNTTATGSSQVPYLWKLSDDRYLVMYSAILTTSTASTTMSQNYSENLCYICDFNDKLHKLDRNGTYAYGGFLYDISYPETAYMKPLVFTTSEGYIQMITPRYDGTYYSSGQYVIPQTALANKQIHNLAYKFGTNKTSVNMLQHPYCYGIAQHSALAGEDITITAIIENDNCGVEE